MSDATAHATPTPKRSLYTEDERTRRRNKAETRFRAYGIAAVSVGLLALVRLAIVLRPGGAPARVRRPVMLGLCILLGAFMTRVLPGWSGTTGLAWVWVLLLVPFALASLGSIRCLRGHIDDG